MTMYPRRTARLKRSALNWELSPTNGDMEATDTVSGKAYFIHEDATTGSFNYGYVDDEGEDALLGSANSLEEAKASTEDHSLYTGSAPRAARRRQPLTLYTAPGCGPCKVAHAAIKRAGVPAHIIDREHATAAELAEAGARAHAAGQPAQFPILITRGQTFTGPAAALKARQIERAQQNRAKYRAAKAQRMANR